MRPRATTPLSVLAATIVVGVLRAADAQPINVEAEHQRGMQLRASGHDADAVVVFRALFERTGEPRALARLGLAEGALQRWSDAEEHLQTALARQSDPWVAQNRANVEEALRAVQRHLGLVDVSCTTPNATVQWGTEAPRPLPLQHPIRVPTGFVDLVVRAPGYSPQSRHVAIPAGVEPIVVAVTLIRDGAATPTPAEPTPRDPPPVEAPRVIAPPPPPPRGTWQRPVGIALLAGAGASLAAGVAGVILREGAAGRFNDGGCRLYPDRDVLSGGGSACAGELSSVNTGETVSLVGFVAAGVLSVAGVTTLLLAPRAHAEPVRVVFGTDARGRGLTAGVTVAF